VARSRGKTVFVQLAARHRSLNRRPGWSTCTAGIMRIPGDGQQPTDTVRRFPLFARANTGKPDRLGTHMDVVGGSVRVPDGGFTSRENIRLSQGRDAAGMEVAECRGDIIPRRCGWAPFARWGMSLGLRSSQQQAWYCRSTWELGSTLRHRASFYPPVMGQGAARGACRGRI